MRHSHPLLRPHGRLAAGIACVLLGAQLPHAHAQQMDMEVMTRWAGVDVVRYHIVGVYQGRTRISSEGMGLADVSDRVEIELSWAQTRAELVGKPTFRNTRSAVSNLRDPEPSCLPPVLKGDYEHLEVLAVEPGLGGDLHLQVKTIYPVVDVAQSCTASRRSTPARTETRIEQVPLPAPVLLAMPGNNEVSASPDRRSIIYKRNGWTWTYTPSVPK